MDWSSQVKVLQSKWIGKSEGAYFDFKVQVSSFDILNLPPVTLPYSGA